MTNPPFKVEARLVGRVKINPNDRQLIDRENFKNANFSGLKYRQLTVVGSRFEACSFENLRITNAIFGTGAELSEYIDCSFDGSRMYMMGDNARFVNCTFRNVDLREWFGWSTELIGCTFSGRLRKAIFSGTVREEMQEYVRRKKNEFLGNDFSAMKLEDVGFRNGIDLSRQKLPAGPEYLYLPDAESAVRHARADVITWGDLDKRREAMVLINNLEEDIRNGQEQLFLRLDDYEKSTREVDEAVFALLRST